MKILLPATVSSRQPRVDNFVLRHKVIHSRPPSAPLSQNGTLRQHKTLLLATVFLLASPFLAWAADKAKPKSRTIKQLIELTLKEGGDKDFMPNVAVGLGLQGSLPGRAISYGADQTSDHRDHQFYILFDDAKKKQMGLVWGNTFISSNADGSRNVDGFKYWTSLDGKLISALHSFGKEGEIQQDKQSIKDSSVKKAYEAEKRFFLVDAIALD